MNRIRKLKPFRSVLVTVGLLILCIPAFAQDQSDAVGDSETEAQTIEELYLGSLVTIGKIDVQVRTGNRDQQMVALRALKEQVEQGAIDPDDSTVLSTISYAVGQGVTRIPARPGDLFGRYHPLVRRNAVSVLASATSDQAIQLLSDVVRYDPEPIVQAEAFLSLGQIGRDENGKTTELIARTMIEETLSRQDQSLIYSGILALEQLAQVEGNTISPLAREALVEVAEGNYPRFLRARSLMAMEELP